MLWHYNSTIRHLDYLQIDHTHAGSSSGFSGSPGKINSIENTKLDDNNDNGDTVLYGLDGGMGKGLDWLASQGVIDVFNSLPAGSDSVILVQTDLFRSPGGLIPRNADVIIVLSEDWSCDLINITNCYKLRMMVGGHSGTPITVLRLAGKGTIEEAILRVGGGLSALQGLKISEILDFGSSIPRDVISPTQMSVENNYRSASFDATGMSPCSHVTLPPSLPYLPFPSTSSSSNVKDVDGKRTFLSAAPYLGKGKNFPNSISTQNRSRSNTQIDSSPLGASVDATDELQLTSSRILPANTPTSIPISLPLPIPSADTEFQLQLEPQLEIVPEPDLTPDLEPMLESEFATESVPEPEPVQEISVDSTVTDVEGTGDKTIISPADSVILPDSNHKDVVQHSIPPLSGDNATQVMKNQVKNDVIISETKAVPEVSTLPPVEKTEETSAKEAAALQWRAAFYRALLEAKNSCTTQNNVCNGLELTLAARVTSHSPGSSTSTSFGVPSGLLSSLPLVPVVKRTYAPRKKSDLSADTTGDTVTDKPNVFTSPASSKNKEEDDDADGKQSKNKKPERKKEKKKSVLTVAREAIGLIPSVALGVAASISTTSLSLPASSCTSSSSSSFSSSSSSSSSIGTVIAAATAPAVPTATLTATSSTSSTSSSSSSSTAAVTADTVHHSKDIEVHNVPVPDKADRAHTDDIDGPCNLNSEDFDAEDSCESCWSADRLAESILSLGMYGIQGSRYVTSKRLMQEVNVVKLGLALRMVYAINRDWQLTAKSTSEDIMGGTAKASTTVYPQRGLVGLHTGPFNGPGRPPTVHPPVTAHTTAPLISAAESASSSGCVGTLNHVTESYTGIYSSQNAQNKSMNKLKIKSEFGPGSHRPPTPEAESRLNRKTLCEMEKIRLSRAGVGVTDAEQLFWSLVEPFTETPLDKIKEPPKIRPPGSFGGNIPPPVPMGINTIQSYSAMSFHESLRELRRKGIAVDPLVQAHPLQNAMRGDLQLVPTWGRKSAITDSHTQFTIRYLFPRSNSSKSARKSRASQNVNPRGERDKEPVRKRVLDQPMLITNVRNVRSRLEAGINSRPSSLGGTVNPFFTRLPPIRTTLKPRGTWRTYVHTVQFMYSTKKNRLLDICTILKFIHLFIY